MADEFRLHSRPVPKLERTQQQRVVELLQGEVKAEEITTVLKRGSQ